MKTPQCTEAESPNINLETEGKLSLDINTLYTSSFDFNKKVFNVKRKHNFAVAPVCLLGFGMCCFCVGLANLDLIKFSQFCMTVFFIFGGIFQYIMGILCWINGETVSSLLAIMYGQYNAGSLFWNVFSYAGYTPHYSRHTFASFNFVWLLMTIPVVIASAKGPKIPCLNNIIVGLSFLLNTIYGLSNNLICLKLNGAVYLMITFLISYISFAVTLNIYYGRTILPLLTKDEKCCWKMNK